MSRLTDLRRFYELLSELEHRLGAARLLGACSGRSGWPSHGVYFFFEPGELRSDSGSGPRVVRVGTHALTENSRTTLWHRLSAHRGVIHSGGGNHRGSIFRLLVGEALLRRDRAPLEGWGVGQSAGAAALKLSQAADDLRKRELPLERHVSAVIRSMPVLWVPTPPADRSVRSLLERNAIGLLSNLGRDPIDEASPSWLGRHSGRELVRGSGLWNNDHVTASYDPAFLEILERSVTSIP